MQNMFKKNWTYLYSWWTKIFNCEETRVLLLELIQMSYLKSCSALTFLTIKVHRTKLAFRAAFRFRSRHLHACSRTLQPRTKLRADSNFPRVPPPRCASQTSDPPRLRLPCCCTENLRRRYASLQNHPRSTRDSRSFNDTAFWHKARWRSGRRRRRAIQVRVSSCTARILRRGFF